MSDRSEQLHQHEDPAADLDRLDHFISDLKALLERYERPEREIDLANCEIESLQRLGKIREKF